MHLLHEIVNNETNTQKMCKNYSSRAINEQKSNRIIDEKKKKQMKHTKFDIKKWMKCLFRLSFFYRKKCCALLIPYTKSKITHTPLTILITIINRAQKKKNKNQRNWSIHSTIVQTGTFLVICSLTPIRCI